MSIDLANPTPEEKKEMLVQALRAVLLPLAKVDIGLGEVDNTSDEDKPVSAAVADALALKANLESPQFTGDVAVPTAASDSDAEIAASTKWVKDRIEEIPVATNVAAGLMSPTDKFKLNGISEGASANSTDAQLRDRETHTGSQPISTVSGLQTALDAKANNSALKPVAYSGSVDDLLDGTTNKLFTAADKTQLTTNTANITSLGNTLSSSVAQLTSDIDAKADKNSPLITGIPKIAGVNPRLDFHDTDATTNVQYWSINPTNGAFTIQTREDDGTFKANIVSIDHATGVASFSVAPVVSGQGAVETVNRRGAVNGYAALGADGKVPSSQLPASGSYLGNWNANTNTPTVVAGTGSNGDEYTVSVAGTQSVTGSSQAFAVGDRLKFTTNGNVWERIPNSQAVSSVNGYTGVITLVKADIGLGGVDNTSDANKPVSTAQLAAINARMLPTDVRDIQINKATPFLALNDTGTASALVRFQRGGVDNYKMGLTTTGNFVLNRYDTSTGAFINSVFTVDTANVVNFLDRPTYAGASLATVTEVQAADPRYRSFIEIGSIANTNGTRFIDFNASPDVDYNARIIREAGVNANFEIVQTGSANLILNHIGTGSIELKAINVYSNRLSLRPNGAEGGELVLEKGTGQTALNGHVIFDTVGTLARIYESGGSFRQFNFDLASGDLIGPSGPFKKRADNYPALPNTVGSSHSFQSNAWADGNADTMNEYAYRHTGTTGWTNVLVRKERVIDGVPAGYIDWGPAISGANFGIAIGSAGNPAIVVYDDRRVNFPVRPTFNGSPLATQAEAAAGGGGAGVSSFNGRTGAVTPNTGDYSADLITYNGNNARAWLDLMRNKLGYWLTPEELGAAGNNIRDDRAEIQTAINSGSCKLGPKTYYCADDLVIPDGTIATIDGVPGITTLEFAANKGLRVEEGGGRITGVKLRNRGTSTSGQLLGIGTNGFGVDKFLFEQVDVSGGYACMRVQNVLSPMFIRCRFTSALGPYGCVFGNGPDATHGVDNAEFISCNFGQTGGNTSGDNIFMNGKVHGVKFISSVIVFGNHGIILNNTGGVDGNGNLNWSSPKFISIIGGGFENGTGNAMRLLYGDDIRLESMYAGTDGSDDGFYMATSFYGRLKFVNSTLRSHGRDAIRCLGGRLTVLGCDIINNGRAVTGDGIRLESGVMDFMIVGNYFGVGPDGINNQRYGIVNNTGNGSLNGVVASNRFRGNTSGAFGGTSSSSGWTAGNQLA